MSSITENRTPPIQSQKMRQIFQNLPPKRQKLGKNKCFPSNPGETVTRTGYQEIKSVTGRLPDNPGELVTRTGYREI